jgi:hypothetical protein
MRATLDYKFHIVLCHALLAPVGLVENRKREQLFAQVDDYLSELIAAIKATHGATAMHVDTVHVQDSVRGQIVWEGDVEVFELKDHPVARIAYAWVRHDDGVRDIVAVLQWPPVMSPAAAVRAARDGEEKKKKP